MAIPPKYARERWGCVICGAYPHTVQVFFAQSPAAVAAREAAREADRQQRATPGWTGPQETTLPGGVWLCGAHAEAAAALQHLPAQEGLAQLRSALQRGEGPG